MSTDIEKPSTAEIALSGSTIVTSTWGTGAPEIVLLHDGLGSIAQWRDLPASIASATGRTVMAYDRRGHGRSTPHPEGPWPTDWLHGEADVLGRLLATIGAQDPMLVGHSDGASIAAIHAATMTTSSPLVMLAAHSWVEVVTVEAIAGMIQRRDRVVTGLARFHDEPEALFDAWAGVWVGDEFASWDIRDLIGSIGCSTVVVQGSLDEYATPEHATSTTTAIGDNASCVFLEDVGHLIHHQAPADVVKLIDKLQRGV